MDQDKTKKTNHTGGLLDVGRHLNQEFAMPTTVKQKKTQKPTKQRQEGELINQMNMKTRSSFLSK